MIQRLSTVVLGAAWSLAPLAAVHGATVALAPQPSVYAAPGLAGVSHTIRIEGAIEPGDTDKLRTLLSGLGDPVNGLVVVELSGLGTDYYEAMRLGQLIRDFRIATVVRKGEKCQSACVLAFLGGSSRDYVSDGTPVPRRYIEIGGTLAFRNYYSKPAPGDQAPNYPVVGLIDYSLRMGVERGFQTSLMALAPGELAHIDTVKRFLIVRACPIGLPRPTTNLAVQASNICSHGLRWFDPDAPHTASPTTALAAKRFVLEATRQNAYLSKYDTSMNLGRELAARIFMESEAATNRLYDELRTAGISLPDLSGSIFQVSGYRTGFYRLECVVTFASDDPDKYTLIVAAPVSSWLAPMVQEKSVICPDLLRFDGNDMINPLRP